MLFPSVNRQKSWLVVLLVLVIAGNIYFHFTFGGTLQQRSAWLDSLFSRLLIPAEKVLDWSERASLSGIVTVKRLLTAEKENRRLHELVERDALELQQLEKLKSENERLQSLVDFKNSVPLSFKAARVIGRDPSLFFRSIEIDRGSEDGLEDDMAVIAPAGVVGKILRVQDSTSTILLITDTNSRVDGVVQRSRTRAIVGGSPEGDLTLRYLPRRNEIRQGDEMVTSGLGNFFPAGIRLGTVVGMAQDPNLVLEQAQLEPAVDFDSLEEVFVVTKKGKK